MKDIKYHIGTIFYIIALILLIQGLTKSFNEKNITFLMLLAYLSRSSYYLIFALLFKTLSKSPNLMNSEKGYMISWILIFLLSLFQINTGVFWSLYCFFARNFQISVRFLFTQSLHLSVTISLFFIIYFKAKHDSKMDSPDLINAIPYSPIMDKTIRILTWLVLILFIFSGLFIILIFIFALPENAHIPELEWSILMKINLSRGIANFFLHVIESINPSYLFGCISYLFSSVNVAALILFKFKSGLRIKTEQSVGERIVHRFPKFDKIITSCIFALSVLFIFSGVILALICIFAVYNKNAQPVAATLLLIESTGMMSLLWISVRSAEKVRIEERGATRAI